MRNIIITAFVLVLACGATKATAQTYQPRSFDIIIEYDDSHGVETNILHKINRGAIVQHIDIRHQRSADKSTSSDEIVASFITFNNVTINGIVDQLKHTPGVTDVIITQCADAYVNHCGLFQSF